MIIKTKEKIIKAGKEILEANLVAGTWGNISLRDEKEDVFVITPSGMDYYDLVPESLVTVDFDGNVVEGQKKPSTETSVHASIYKIRPDVNAIIHTHSIHASACAAACESIPCLLEDVAALVGGDIGVAQYALPGTPQLAQNVIEALEDRNAVLMANHGVLCVGPDLDETIKTCRIVEKAALVYINCKILGKYHRLKDEHIQAIRSNYLYKYGQK